MMRYIRAYFTLHRTAPHTAPHIINNAEIHYTHIMSVYVSEMVLKNVLLAVKSDIMQTFDHCVNTP